MNAILYSRFSPRPEGETSESIELQQEKSEAYCTAMSHVIIARYADREISGARADNRPGLQDALQLALTRRALLVCYSLSRLARNTRDALAIIDQLHAAGAHLALLDVNLDTSTPTGRCVFTILAAVAELERQQTAQRTSDAMRRHQAQGKRMSRYLPYGYRLEHDQLVPDAGEREVIAQVCSLKAEGFSLRQIGVLLEKQGHGCRGRAWHHSTIKKIIEREKATEF